jgi:hypothetical protein
MASSVFPMVRAEQCSALRFAGSFSEVSDEVVWVAEPVNFSRRKPGEWRGGVRNFHNIKSP